MNRTQREFEDGEIEALPGLRADAARFEAGGSEVPAELARRLRAAGRIEEQRQRVAESWTAAESLSPAEKAALIPGEGNQRPARLGTIGGRPEAEVLAQVLSGVRR